MSALGTMGKSSDSLITILDDLKFDKTTLNIIKKLMNIATFENQILNEQNK